MPNVILPLPDVSQSVTRPVIIDIVAQVKDITGIGSDVKIFYPGEIQAMSTPGSSIESNSDRTAIFNSERYTYIEVNENYDEAAIGTTAINREEYSPVYLDEAIGSKLAPIYATSSLEISFKYVSSSKTEVTRWRDNIRMKVSQMRDINLHSIKYHYGFPVAALLVIKNIYENTEAVEPYGKTFEEYVVSHSSDTLTLVGDLVGNNASLVFSETQSRIIGMFDFSAIPEKAERDGNGTWSVSFSYKLTYEKPIGCHLRYPIMVHNQLLKPEFTTWVDDVYDLDKIDKTYSNSLYNLAGFEADAILNDKMPPNYILRLPSFDDFNIPAIPSGTGTVVIALSEVGEDKRSLLNLNELGDIAIDADILEFIRESEYKYMGNYYQSVVGVSLYRDNYLSSPGTLLCDKDLNVKAAKTDLNLRRVHRVRFHIVTDLTMVSRAAIDRLLKYPKALVKIIGSINEILRSVPDFNNFSHKSYLSLDDFNPIYQILTGQYLGNTGGRGANYDYTSLANNWPYKNNMYGIFKDIDPLTIQRLKDSRIMMKTALVTGVVALSSKLLK